MKNPVKVKVVQVVQIDNHRYGPGKAREAACEYARAIAIYYKSKNVSKPIGSFRDFNAWHKVAFHRSLPVFEKLLGPVKNRKNPRTLIDLNVSQGTIAIIDN
jgi:rare lipoprotein A (peptidoglycan hydrolase)